MHPPTPGITISSQAATLQTQLVPPVLRASPVFPNGELVALPGGGYLEEVIHGVGGLIGGLQVHSHLVPGGGASGEIVQLVQSCKYGIPTPDQPVCVSIHHRHPRLSSLYRLCFPLGGSFSPMISLALNTEAKSCRRAQWGSS